MQLLDTRVCPSDLGQLLLQLQESKALATRGAMPKQPSTCAKHHMARQCIRKGRCLVARVAGPSPRLFDS